MIPLSGSPVTRINFYYIIKVYIACSCRAITLEKPPVSSISSIHQILCSCLIAFIYIKPEFNTHFIRISQIRRNVYIIISIKLQCIAYFTGYCCCIVNCTVIVVCCFVVQNITCNIIHCVLGDGFIGDNM